MIKVFTAPEIPKDGELDGYSKVFLAGTIDDGSSEDWQKQVVDYLNGSDFKLAIFNPRRNNWNKDASTMDIEKQILWEQKMLEQSDMIVMMLLDGSQSPISLMELGQYANSNKLVVFCTEKFHRFTNVRVICELHKIPLFMTNDVEAVKCMIVGMKIFYGEVNTNHCSVLWNKYMEAKKKSCQINNNRIIVCLKKLHRQHT